MLLSLYVFLRPVPPPSPRRSPHVPHHLLCSSLIPFSLRAPSRRRFCSGTPAGNAEKERTREEHQRGGYRDERGTEEYERQECDGERQSLAEKERKRDREDGSAEGSGKSARERKRGDDFRERGLRGPPRRGAESPSSPGAAARIFLPLSGPLSRPLFFFPARPPSRRARCFSSPWTASIFLFERLRSHAPAPQWPRTRKFVAGAAPFPATPASFSPIPLAPQPPSRAQTPVSPFPARSPSYALFSLPFFVLAAPPPPPAAAVDVDPTIRRLCHSRVRRTLQLWPQGCILRDPSNHPSPPLPRRALRRDTFARYYIRYLRRVMYAPVFGRVFTRPLFDDRLCLMLNETRRSYYRSVYCLTLFRRSAALDTDLTACLHASGRICLRLQLRLRNFNRIFLLISHISSKHQSVIRISRDHI